MATLLQHGRVAIAATNTAEALAGAKEVDWVLLWCPFSNEQAIRIGDSGVTNTDATTEGLPVIPGAPSLLLKSCDLGDINIIGYIGDKIYYVADSGYTLGTGV